MYEFKIINVKNVEKINWIKAFNHNDNNYNNNDNNNDQT